MMIRATSRSTLFISLLALLVPGSRTHAQSTTGRPSADLSRAQLEERGRVADSLHLGEEAFHLRTRLRNGDFEVGDRVIVAYEGVGLQRGDTLVVQAGKQLRLGEPMGDLNLQGVLRSEVADSVAGRVSRYFKNVVIHVTPLLRVAIVGAVRAPGFYYARGDMPLSDFIMRSGGQDQTADLSSTIIRRGQQTLWSAEDVRTALRDGVTLEGLNLDPGDEIAVGVRGASVWPKLLQYGIPIASAIVLQLLLRR